MAQPTNTFDTFEAIGNREDLTDIIWNISPTETPFTSMIAREPISATLHEWQTDTLAAASTANRKIQGDDKSGASLTATTRAQNRTQISDKTISISGTQDAVDSAGRTTETALQMSKAGQELKRDIEKITAGNQAIATGNATLASALRSLEAWYTTNTSRGGTGANGSTTAAATDGTQREFTEALLKGVVQSIFTNGGDPDVLLVGPVNKQKVSGFSGNATRFNDASNDAINASVSVYVSDFGDFKIVPGRFNRERTAHVLDSSLWALGFLRPVHTFDLSKTGDSDRKTILAEYTLAARNEAGSGVIADLTTS